MNAMYRTAVHEAGHAVVGRRLGVRIEFISIDKSDTGPGTAGYVQGSNSSIDRLKPTDRIAYSMAGFQSELQLLTGHTRIWGKDLNDINRICLESSHPDSLRDQAERKAKKLVSDNRRLISGLADKLLECRRMNFEAFEAWFDAASGCPTASEPRSVGLL